MSNTEATKSTTFETVTCSRCGGSGHYSFCTMYGSTCFKCGGAKKVYTKRGARAKAIYDEGRKVQAKTLKAGDLLYCDSTMFSKGGFDTIVSIEANGVTDPAMGNYGYININCAKKGGLQCSPDYWVTKGWDAEHKAAFMAFALAFQDTLTKTGTVKKGA